MEASTSQNEFAFVDCSGQVTVKKECPEDSLSELADDVNLIEPKVEPKEENDNHNNRCTEETNIDWVKKEPVSEPSTSVSVKQEVLDPTELVIVKMEPQSVEEVGGKKQVKLPAQLADTMAPQHSVKLEKLPSAFSSELMELKCQKCNQLLSSLSSCSKLHRCLKTEIGKKYHKCVDCGESFQKIPILLRHRKKMHFKFTKYVCDVCKKSFDLSCELKQHKVEHFKNKESSLKLTCEICNCSFSSKSELNNHYETVHLQHKPFNCESCNESFGSETGLEAHNYRFHSKPKPFVCSTCEEHFSQKECLDKHLSDMHFMCTTCHIVFISRTQLSLHVSAVHDKKKLYNCKLCGKSFSYRQSLNLHKQNMHNMNSKLGSFSCEGCGKTYKNESWLLKHKDTVHASVEGPKEGVLSEMS